MILYKQDFFEVHANFNWNSGNISIMGNETIKITVSQNGIAAYKISADLTCDDCKYAAEALKKLYTKDAEPCLVFPTSPRKMKRLSFLRK